MRKVMSGCLLAASLSFASGCQGFSRMDMPSGSRVPPPGTGTFQTPSNYYGGAKPGAVSPTSTSMTPGTQGSVASSSTGGQVSTAVWQPPTVDQLRGAINNSANSAMQDAANRANQVVQASTSRAASAIEQYTDPVLQAAASLPPPSNANTNVTSAPPGATRSLSDSTPSPAGQLDWQPPR